jgi:mono/diheme cytochrome c family protein
MLKKICNQKNSVKMKKNIFKILSLVSISLLIMGNVQAQKWTIDDELKDATLKVAYDETNIDAGKAVFEKNCKACHRDIVIADKNDRPLPSAPNLGNKEFQKGNTDGAIFCKITHGNGAGMPPYESMISETERWQVIAYLRSYCESYVPATDDGAKAAPVEKFDGKLTKISTSYNKDSQTIVVQLEGEDAEGNIIAPKGVKVTASIKRYFGNMKLCDGDKTNDKGLVSLDIAGIPADTSGFIVVYAKTTDGALTTENKIQINDGYTWVNPLDGEHIWGTREHTPWWLMLMYFGATLTVLGVIGWAVFQLFRIYNLRER